MEPLLVVLDLDETLIHAEDGESEIHPDLRPDFYSFGHAVYKRPGVHEFVTAVLDEFRIAVWTSASKDYASVIVNELFGPRKDELVFFWARERCTQRSSVRMFDEALNTEPHLLMGWQPYYWTKEIRKLRRRGYDVERIVAVDDTPRKWENSFGNLVRVPEWKAEDPEDNVLGRLLPYLRWLNEQPNVRRVEKRGWHLSEE